MGQPISSAALIAVDWGTSNMRARLLDAAGGVLAEAESEDGIARVEAGGHEAAFERLVGAWPRVPAIMAGMIGSRQGWREAAYLPCPAAVGDLAASVLRFDTASGRPVAIVPGIMVRSAARDGDVMRGEETQIVGMIDGEPDFSGVAILPGTHSKWVSIGAATVKDFQTFLTGEIFELLSQKSFLRHSVAAGDGDLTQSPDFALAVRRTAEEGLPFLSAIFSVRVRALLDNVDRADNLAYLSGLVIGGEIAAARAAGRFNDATTLRIVGSRSLGRAYARAFALLGVQAVGLDGNGLALAGLIHIARTIGLLPATVPGQAP
jgi:2-dehydro-3-deoxygalactonokinase